MTPALSRRRLLSGLGAVGIGGLVAADATATAASAAGATQIVPFRAANQAGIVTPQQDRLTFAAFDVVTKDRAELISLLKTWTTAAESMTALTPDARASLYR